MMTVRKNAANQNVCLACGMSEFVLMDAESKSYGFDPKAIGARYCVSRCVQIGKGFEAYDELGQSPQPHLHRKCSRCGYEWLEATRQPIPQCEEIEVAE